MLDNMYRWDDDDDKETPSLTDEEMAQQEEDRDKEDPYTTNRNPSKDTSGSKRR